MIIAPMGFPDAGYDSIGGCEGPNKLRGAVGAGLTGVDAEWVRYCRYQ